MRVGKSGFGGPTSIAVGVLVTSTAISVLLPAR